MKAPRIQITRRSRNEFDDRRVNADTNIESVRNAPVYKRPVNEIRSNLNQSSADMGTLRTIKISEPNEIARINGIDSAAYEPISLPSMYFPLGSA